MNENTTPSPRRPRYKVPTHLKMPDKVLFGLTARQLLILLIGASLAYNLWFQLELLATHGAWGQVLRIFVVAVPGVVALAFALIELAERPLELWCWLALRYWQQPKVCVWRSLRLHEPPRHTQQRRQPRASSTTDTSHSPRQGGRS